MKHLKYFSTSFDINKNELQPVGRDQREELYHRVHHQAVLDPRGRVAITQKNEFHDIICWSPNNREILIKDQKALEKDVLPLFFRHSKVDSFIRQLNMYGFRKVSKGFSEKSAVSFKNDNFKRGNM